MTDLTCLRAVWDDHYRPGLRDLFAVYGKRQFSGAEIDRWAPFEPLVAIITGSMSPAEIAAAIETYARDRLEKFKWEFSYWWPWTELEDW